MPQTKLCDLLRRKQIPISDWLDHMGFSKQEQIVEWCEKEGIVCDLHLPPEKVPVEVVPEASEPLQDASEPSPESTNTLKKKRK